ncbi:peptidase T [Campylobacter concisus]|uniref:peptidase T n=1 Tax=Campylobacter concisus TaxID=199 RepID=UPI0011E809C7|nr:peptidase T [Campylobacter concisus]
MDIVERFINYTKFNTTTNKENGLKGIMPSNPTEYELAKFLKDELSSLGIKDIILQDSAILIAKIPANCEKAPSIAFFAHLDTSSEQKNDTKAKIVKYTGGDICLNEEQRIYLKFSDNPELKKYVGDDIVVTDGTSLLGADDKAAIASIVNMASFFMQNPEIKHGKIVICFVPDEEQGLLGAKALDVNLLGANFGYCLDCCEIGELIYENWNAADCTMVFKGVSAHPMNAKGKLVNSLLLAHKFISLLPGGEVPECTEGKEGYFWVKELSGNSAKTTLKIDIREFDEVKFQKRLEFLSEMASSFNKIYADRCEITLKTRYENVFKFLKDENSLPIKLAKDAFSELNITPNIKPMRGGYDGAAISAKGVPTLNLFTGGNNFHSIFEYLPVSSLKAASEVIKKIVINAAK